MYLVINKCVTAVKMSNFSGHYLRNRSTLDIGVLGYIGIVQHKEHSPEVLSIPPGTPCIYLYICFTSWPSWPVLGWTLPLPFTVPIDPMPSNWCNITLTGELNKGRFTLCFTFPFRHRSIFVPSNWYVFTLSVVFSHLPEEHVIGGLRLFPPNM